MDAENWLQQERDQAAIEAKNTLLAEFDHALDLALYDMARELSRVPQHRGESHEKLMERARTRYRHLFPALYHMLNKTDWKHTNNDHEDDGS